MPWVAVELDNTLVQFAPDPMSGELGVAPVDGAVEAMNQLALEGHKITVYTSRLAAMPTANKQQFKDDVETTLVAMGFPPMDVWTGTTKPDADIFIGNNNVTFDGDWGLVLAQTQMMMEERGLIPPPMGDPASYEMGQEDTSGQMQDQVQETGSNEETSSSKNGPKDKKKELSNKDSSNENNKKKDGKGKS